MRKIRTDKELEGYARRLRRAFGQEFLQVLDIPAVVEGFKKVFPGTVIETVGDDALPHDEARTDCLNKHIVLRRTTWISALNGHPRAYMTVLHELAHIAFAGNRNRLKSSKSFRCATGRK